MQSVTADAVVICGDEILLIKRNNEPFRGKYAVPGGHLDETDLNTDDTALRELQEETGIHPHDERIVMFGQAGAISTKGRDPRGRYVTVVYYFLLSEKPELNVNPEEVQKAEWVKIDDLHPDDMAFDHDEVVDLAVKVANEECAKLIWLSPKTISDDTRISYINR